MKERLEKLIGDLVKRREEILDTYLKTLVDYSGGRAADEAGCLNDLDRHITNLHLELKRLGAING